MEADVKPKPEAQEREAILAALDPAGELPFRADESAWRQAALREAAEESSP